MNLNKAFEQGITKDAYIASQEKHQDGFMKIYNDFQLPEADKDFLASKANYRILVLAEEWCGHCMLDIPILLRINEQANLPIRFLPRDSHLDVMDHYLTNEKRYIPIVIFIDEAGEEISKWGPMAPEIEQYIDEKKQSLPAADSPDYEAKFQDFIKVVGRDFENDPALWTYVYEDLKKALPL